MLMNLILFPFRVIGWFFRTLFNLVLLGGIFSLFTGHHHGLHHHGLFHHHHHHMIHCHHHVW